MRVAVFAGSGSGIGGHRLVAAEFGRAVAEPGVGIVYGGHVGPTRLEIVGLDTRLESG